MLKCQHFKVLAWTNVIFCCSGQVYCCSDSEQVYCCSDSEQVYCCSDSEQVYCPLLNFAIHQDIKFHAEVS